MNKQQIVEEHDVAHDILHSLIEQFGPWTLIAVMAFGAWRLFVWRKSK